jgi:ABC-type transport system involved in multi-copper enzyme maturation permease subunit
MMTFLAILKDSWREALDSKVLYVLLGLSVLVIVFVAGIGFEAKPADKGMEAILDRFPGARQNFGFMSQRGPVRYDMENFQQLNSSKPWDGEYRFELVAREVPVQQPNEENKDDDKDKKKKEQESSEYAFPLVVWVSSLQTEEAQLSPEDREARKRLLSMHEQAQALPPEQLKQFLNDKMKEEVKKVSPAQMERFLKQQMAAHGALETTSVHFQSKADHTYRFVVEARGRPETYRTWPHSRSWLYGAIRSQEETPIGANVFGIEENLVGNWGAGITMMIATIITAFYIPNMLHKGTIDLLLAKPVRRSTLLIYKYIGGLTFMFINTIVVVVGIWLVLGIRSGLWAPAFLLCILTFTFEFAIFYAVSTLFGVLTRSAIVSILMTCFAWLLFFIVGIGYQMIQPLREFDIVPGWLTTTADVAHFVLPRYKDIDALNTEMVSRDLLAPENPQRKMMEKVFASIQWGETIGFTLAFIAVMLGLSCWRFATRDY